LIDEPWTPEEIGDIWGLTKKRIRQSEVIARKKVQKEGPYNQSKKQLVS
jgi:DNA-directed RNA polymerase sigma subunit (sigma70/sigma32)